MDLTSHEGNLQKCSKAAIEITTALALTLRAENPHLYREYRRAAYRHFSGGATSPSIDMLVSVKSAMTRVPT